MEFQSLGTDAEVFWIKNGEPFPVCGLLGGTKLDPRPIPELGNGFMIQEDNVTAEFNIPPCKTADQFSDAIEKQLEWNRIQARLHGCEISIVPSLVFHPKNLQTLQAQTFGCDPELNAWSRTRSRVSDAYRLSLKKEFPKIMELRTAAAHIHTGFLVDGQVSNDMTIKERLVKLQDLALGIPFGMLEEDPTRMFLYGKFGSFRPKPYGVEWRTLSNRWLSNPTYRKVIFTVTKTLINYFHRYSLALNNKYADSLIQEFQRQRMAYNGQFSYKMRKDIKEFVKEDIKISEIVLLGMNFLGEDGKW